MKGSRYVVLQRDLAKFFVHNPISIKFYNWMTDMMVGDESFYSTLVRVEIQSNGSVIQNFTKNTTNGQVRKKTGASFTTLTEEKSQVFAKFQI
jgi:hypothetical protein